MWLVWDIDEASTVSLLSAKGLFLIPIVLCTKCFLFNLIVGFTEDDFHSSLMLSDVGGLLKSNFTFATECFPLTGSQRSLLEEGNCTSISGFDVPEVISKNVKVALLSGDINVLIISVSEILESDVTLVLSKVYSGLSATLWSEVDRGVVVIICCAVTSYLETGKLLLSLV